MSSKLNTRESLLLKVKLDKTGCWLWQGHVGKNGYGQVSYQNKHDRPHRVFYTIFKGVIPKDKEIDHLCRARACVNPAHLEAVSHKVNAKRGHDAHPYNRLPKKSRKVK